MIENYKSPRHLVNAHMQLAQILNELESLVYVNFNGSVPGLSKASSEIEKVAMEMIETQCSKFDDPEDGKEFQRLADEADQVERMLAAA